jgi:hypothetical protein
MRPKGSHSRTNAEIAHLMARRHLRRLCWGSIAQYVSFATAKLLVDRLKLCGAALGFKISCVGTHARLQQQLTIETSLSYGIAIALDTPR